MRIYLVFILNELCQCVIRTATVEKVGGIGFSDGRLRLAWQGRRAGWLTCLASAPPHPQVSGLALPPELAPSSGLSLVPLVTVATTAAARGRELGGGVVIVVCACDGAVIVNRQSWATSRAMTSRPRRS